MLRETIILVIFTLLISGVSACSFKIGGNQTGVKPAETAGNEQSNGSGALAPKNASFSQAAKTGTYRYKSGNYNNAIGIEEIGGNRLRVSIVVNYEYKVDGEWMVNSGSASEEVELKGDTAVLVPEDFPACEITLKFSGGKIIVKQKGTEMDCGFGGKTYAAGTYVKTGNEINPNEMIDDVPENSTAENDGGRIRFASGKSSTVVSAAISHGERKTYLIGARAGQTMEVKITDGGANNDVVFSLYAPDGKNLMGNAENGDSYDSAWKGKLPKTGDYKIVLSTIESESANFKMSITIR